MSKAQTSVVWITPDTAKQILASNTAKNAARLKDRVVKNYADQMRKGQWQFNGESVVISETGKLLDGQHRLHAIVQSGVSVQMVVVQGVEDVAYTTLDTGFNRNFAQVAKMQGHQNVITLGGAIVVYQNIKFHREKPILLKNENYTKSGENNPRAMVRIKPKSPTNTYMNMHEMLDFIETNPILHEIASFCGAGTSKANASIRVAFKSQAIPAGIAFWLYQNGHSIKDIEAFYKAVVAKVGLQENSAKTALMRFLDKRITDKSFMLAHTSLDVAAKTIGAYNYDYLGKPLRSLSKFTADNFPEVVEP